MTHPAPHRPTPATIRMARRADHIACAALTPLEALAEYDRRHAAEVARIAPGFRPIMTGETPERAAAITLAVTAPKPLLDAMRNHGRIEAGEGIAADPYPAPGLTRVGERQLIAINSEMEKAA